MFGLFEIMGLNSIAMAIMAPEIAKAEKEAKAKEKVVEEVRKAKASFSLKEDGFRANFEPWTEDDRFAMFRNED